jgi:hypothetical protein
MIIIINRRIFEYKISFLIFLFTLLVNLSEGYSQSLKFHQDKLLCEYLAQDAEKKHGLPKNILLSISRVESGYHKVDGITRAWPWTLNAGGDSAYFQTKEAALNSLKDRIKKGVTNIDIGCMQLNYRWHKKFFNNLNEMMSPTKNVDYGARFLKRLHERHGSWEKAVKYYHSSKSKFNVKYYRKVRAVWKRENNQSSLTPKLVAAVFKPETKKLNILKKNENTVPLIEINKRNKDIYIKKTEAHELNEKENKAIIVSTVNFQKAVDADTAFDFTSFVKNVSRKNTALPKYIRDNWTIVLSIRNQLQGNN